jgi:carbamoyltransferase
MQILGISCYYHDAAAVLLRDGQLIAAAEEERFSRIKHDYGFPHRAIRFCLEEGGIRGTDLDYVAFFEKPFRKFDRILMTVLQTYPKSWRVFRESMITWMLDKLWVGDVIESELGVPKDRVLFSEHHLSHAASAFLCSPFEEAAILTVDGVGEWTTTTWGTGRGNEIRLTHKIEFPHSLGLLYSAFTAFLGFEVNEGEYKVMGMAPYGTPRYVEKVWKLIHQNEDGSFYLNMDYFSFHHSTERTFNGRFTALFGEPRAPGVPFFTEQSGYPSYFGDQPSNYSELCALNQYYADVAASIQCVTENVLVRMADRLQERTRQRRLCIAGGVGLNSVANSRILRETQFEELFVQPAAGDGGGALGAALWVYHSLLGQPRTWQLEHAYWGKAYKQEEIASFLIESGIPHRRFDSDDELLGYVVNQLTNGSVIGWYQGRFEWGPRALGNRSILADPRRPEMKDIVNAKIKFREPYRPFAPSVLAKSAECFFDLQNACCHHPARYMLYVVPVRESKKPLVSAITHVDGTARLQTVFENLNPRYYKLIETFAASTGIPLLLNTSFNLKGEPIVTTPADAYQTFSKSGMDCLVLENYLVEKKA